ncbi:MAG: hypothetical protein C0426_16445 [Rhodobacter sp.]|nr:hypothetical protein [Rhodobacter sp.]
MAPPTVKDLLDARGKHQFAMLRVETLEEAEAAAKAGVELLSVPPSMVMDRRLRDVAPPGAAAPGRLRPPRSSRTSPTGSGPERLRRTA